MKQSQIIENFLKNRKEMFLNINEIQLEYNNFPLFLCNHELRKMMIEEGSDINDSYILKDSKIGKIKGGVYFIYSKIFNPYSYIGILCSILGKNIIRDSDISNTIDINNITKNIVVPLYVGKAITLRGRLNQHATGSTSNFHDRFYNLEFVDLLDEPRYSFSLIENEKDRVYKEKELILKYKPILNIQ